MELLRPLETDLEQAQRRIKSRYALSQMYKAGFPKPRFGTTAYQQYLQKEWISPEEAESDYLKSLIRAERTGQKKVAGTWQGLIALASKATPPMRWANQTPIPSDQYAPPMATTAARDNRITPQAKALLQVIHARCGREGETDTTKGTLANVMSRSERSIQRYIGELVRFGYLLTFTRKNARGLYTGLKIMTQESVKPFWHQWKKLNDWMDKSLRAEERGISSQNPDIQEETTLPHKNRFKYIYRKGHAFSVT